MRRNLWIIAAATIALGACGGSESATSATSATTSGAGGASDPASSSSSSSGAGGSSGKICMAGNVCLQVKQVDTGGTLATGRLAVVWYPFDSASATPPVIAYDVAFDPATTRIDIPYTSLAPAPAALLTGDPPLGFARIGVTQDQNHDGKLDLAELDASLYGVGVVGIVYSQKAYHPSPASVAAVVPEGINAGTHAYRIIPKSQGSKLDKLGIAFEGTVFNLEVCSDAPGCVVPSPELQ